MMFLYKFPPAMSNFRGLTPDREELAWAAGFFDGEGCISYLSPRKGRSRRLSLIVAGSHLPSLIRFRRAVFGAGKIYDGPATNKPTWQWRTGCFEDVQMVIAAMWAFLSEERKVQYTEKVCAYLCRPEPENFKSEDQLKLEQYVSDWKRAKEMTVAP